MRVIMDKYTENRLRDKKRIRTETEQDKTPGGGQRKGRGAKNTGPRGRQKNATLVKIASCFCESLCLLQGYNLALSSEPATTVVVRIPSGPLGSLKRDPPKGNGRRPQKMCLHPRGAVNSRPKPWTRLRGSESHWLSSDAPLSDPGAPASSTSLPTWCELPFIEYLVWNWTMGRCLQQI